MLFGSYCAPVVAITAPSSTTWSRPAGIHIVRLSVLPIALT